MRIHLSNLDMWETSSTPTPFSYSCFQSVIRFGWLYLPGTFQVCLLQSVSQLLILLRSSFSQTSLADSCWDTGGAIFHTTAKRSFQNRAHSDLTSFPVLNSSTSQWVKILNVSLHSPAPDCILNLRFPFPPIWQLCASGLPITYLPFSEVDIIALYLYIWTCHFPLPEMLQALPVVLLCTSSGRIQLFSYPPHSFFSEEFLYLYSPSTFT